MGRDLTPFFILGFVTQLPIMFIYTLFFTISSICSMF